VGLSPATGRAGEGSAGRGVNGQGGWGGVGRGAVRGGGGAVVGGRAGSVVGVGRGWCRQGGGGGGGVMSSEQEPVQVIMLHETLRQSLLSLEVSGGRLPWQRRDGMVECLVNHGVVVLRARHMCVPPAKIVLRRNMSSPCLLNVRCHVINRGSVVVCGAANEAVGAKPRSVGNVVLAMRASATRGVP